MLDFLTEEERVRLREVDADVYGKLESCYKTMRENLSKMEAERKSDRVNREQLFNQLEQKVTDTVEALEMMKLENEELRNENAQLKQEREEWERRLQGVLSKFDGMDDSSAS